MEDAAVFFLQFDTTSGPQIVNCVGHVDFGEKQLVCLKTCAFPDTVVPNPAQSVIFVYKIDKYFCYSIFSTTPDPTIPRGHRQVSYVIATRLPYVYPFTRILHSSMSMRDVTPDDMLLLFADFVSKSLSVFPVAFGEDQEIPTFDGGLPVGIAKSVTQLLDLSGGIGWTPQCKKYYLNSNFLGLDLVSCLSLNSLINGRRSSVLLRLWESAVLNESIMVYGSTPGVVCSAALAIASLTYPEPSPENLMPFVAVTDPRYQGITSCPSKGLIAGFSNPIALQRSSAFDLLFTTGFDATTDGLTGTPKTSAKRTVGFEKSTSSEIRHFLYMNNCKVAEAVSSCLDDLGNANPYAAFVGQVDADSLADHLLKQNVALTVSAKTFAMKLLRSELFARIWKERCSYAKLIGSLKEFSADEFCTGIGEHELIDFYSMVREVKKTYGIQNEEIGKWIERDLQTITMYLSPDLILAP